MDAIKKVAIAREHLIVDQRFFGTLICSMPTVPATRAQGFPIKTMATDGRTIWFNPGFVDTLTLAETKGVLMHEVLHKANGHHLRRAGRNHRIWNQACDYAINPIVMAAGQVLPVGGLVNPSFADWSAEEIYEQLTLNNQAAQQQPKKEKSDDKQKGLAAGVGGDDEGDDPDDADGSGDEGDDGSSGDEDEDGNAVHHPDERAEEDAGEDEVEVGTGADHGLILEPLNEEGTPLSPAEIQQMADELRVEIVQAAALAAGDMPAGLSRLVEDAKNPRQDWRDVLRRFVTRAVETPVDQSWARPNRRFIHQGVYLPGWRKEGTNKLLMVIDTSGSTITTPALPRFYAEMKRILEDTRPDEVTVIWCDSMVQMVETYTDASQIPQICPGGGGTMFSPVWRKVRELGIQPAGCVFFTDLICNDFGEQPEFPVLWAKWGHRPRSVPFGEVLDINQP